MRRSRRGRLREIHGLLSRCRKCSTSAWTSPGTVYSVGTIVEVMPSCCAASAVTGPIDATTVPDRRSGACSSPSALTKWRTDDALVNVTASTCRSSSSL